MNELDKRNIIKSLFEYGLLLDIFDDYKSTYEIIQDMIDDVSEAIIQICGDLDDFKKMNLNKKKSIIKRAYRQSISYIYRGIDAKYDVTYNILNAITDIAVDYYLKEIGE